VDGRVAARSLRALAEDGGAATTGRRSRIRRSTTRRSATTRRPSRSRRSRALDELDPELRRTYEKLGISLDEQKRLAGVAVDAVFDSVSVATTFKKELEKHGIIFCPFSGSREEPPRSWCASTWARWCR